MRSFYNFIIYFSITVFFILVPITAYTQGETTGYKKLSIEEYKKWMKKYFDELIWIEHEFDKKLTKKVLQNSYKLGNSYIINNQNQKGNFIYEYDFISDKVSEDDNQTRQAGAVWALSLMYTYKQDDKTKKALDKGLEFFLNNTVTGSKDGNLIISYPGDDISIINTIAIISLSIIDYLTLDKKGIIKIDSEYKQKLYKYLDGYLNHIKSSYLPNKHFSSFYDLKNKTYSDKFYPYGDGQVLLVFIKAAKYLNLTELLPIIKESSMVMAKHYTYEQWIHNYDSPKTKGFFQWSCMAFWEYQDADWEDAEFYRQHVLSLSWWMINVHKTLFRKANTAYVYEGVIPALLIARKEGRKDIVSDLEFTIDRALYKLTTWQVGGPLKSENFYLVNNPVKNKIAIGGIMNYKDRPLLRIDVTQHQMHSVIKALRYVYK